MKKKVFSAEQIIGKLREAEILLSQGSTVGEASGKLGVTEQTYCRWRREYGGMPVDVLIIQGEGFHGPPVVNVDVAQ